MSATQLSIPSSLAVPFAPAAASSSSFASARRATVELASSRAAANNPNHHLWKNGRLWWIAFTLIHDGWRQERVRQSLGTDNLLEARRRRDAILSLFSQGGPSCIDPDQETAAVAVVRN